jgi:hypothetical protein
VAVAALFVSVTQLLAPPRFISRINFENPTAYDLHIEVTDAKRDGWMPVGTARRDGTTIAEEIYDIGDVWLFRFGGQGEHGGELPLTRTQLKQDKWRVQIPAGVGDQLRERGASPPP